MRTTFKIRQIRKMGAIFVFALTTLAPSFLFAQPYIAWIQRYNGPGNGSDGPVKLVLDRQGNVYIVGASQGTGTGTDVVILKYDSKGNFLWERLYNGPAGGDDLSRTIGLDSSGNVYVACTGTGIDLAPDYTVLKYDSFGNRLWVVRRSFRDPVWFGDFTVNVTGDSYVAGSDYVGGISDFHWFIYHIDPEGRNIPHPLPDWGPAITEEGRRIAVSPDGTIYFAGCILWGPSCLLMKFGKFDSWSVSTTMPSEALAIDNKENVYFAAIYLVGNFIAQKYDSTGTLMWTRNYNGPANGSERFSELVADTSGNVFVTGLSPGVGTGNDYATVKYDSTGKEVWVRRYDGPGNGSDIPHGVAVDGNGNVYVTGRSVGNGTNLDFATIKYDSMGSQDWLHRYNGPANSVDGAVDVIADSGGNVWVIGGSDGDILTIKYSPTPILKGDLDESGVLTLNDIISLLNCVFLEGNSCPPAFADVNCDALLTAADIVVLLRSFFLTATPPC